MKNLVKIKMYWQVFLKGMRIQLHCMSFRMESGNHAVCYSEEGRESICWHCG